MLAIVGGKLCCVVALVPCTSGTTLYSTTALVGSVGTVVEYSSVCYTVTSTTTCGTIITGPFTTVANCAACSPATCPISPGTGYPSTVTLGGWSGIITNCGGAFPFVVGDCSLGTPWDGGLTKQAPLGFPISYLDDSGGSTKTILLSDSTCALLVQATLTCFASLPVAGVPGWQLSFHITASGGNGCEVTVTYEKTGIAIVTGSYAYASTSGATCAGGFSVGWPGTMSVS